MIFSQRGVAGTKEFRNRRINYKVRKEHKKEIALSRAKAQRKSIVISNEERNLS